jgi:hypothetical protein
MGRTTPQLRPEVELLPAITSLRTRAIEGGRQVVVVGFENGATIEYRAPEGTEETVTEAWIPPAADSPAVTNERDPDEDADVETLACRTIAEYLSFDDADRARSLRLGPAATCQAARMQLPVPRIDTRWPSGSRANRTLRCRGRHRHR